MEIINNIKVNTESRNMFPDRKILGVEGENQVEKLVFKLDKFYGGVARLETRQDDTLKYLVMETDLINEEYYIIINNSLLKGSSIDLQIRIVVEDDTVFKSKFETFEILEGINATQEIEENQLEWVDEVDTRLNKAEEDIEELKQSGTGGGTSDYNDLENKPSINNVTLKGNKTLDELGIQPKGNYVSKDEIPDTSEFITKEVDNLVNYELKSNTGTNIALSIDQNTYVMTLELKNTAGTILSQKTIDLPLETMVIGATYEAGTLKLTLKNGQTLDVDITDIISGLVSDTRKIAGLDLKDDITKEELRVALEITSLITSALTNYYNKTEVDTKLADKVDKETGKSLVEDTEITRLKTLQNYDDTELRNELANKVGFTDYATTSSAGIAVFNSNSFMVVNGKATLKNASETQIDNRQAYTPITSGNLDYAVHSVVDTTIITTIDSNTLLLDNNQDARLGELSTLVLNMPSEIDDRYESCFSFKSGETATTLTYSATPIKWQGDDTNSANEFIPEANTSYEISIRKVNDTDIVARVGGY